MRIEFYLCRMNKNLLSWILLLSLSLVWGSSFILMKRGLEAFSSEQVAALRIGIAALFLFPFLLKHYKIDFKKYGLGLFIMGMFGNFIPAFLFTKAETGISSSLAGMLNALTPLFTLMVGSIALKTKAQKPQIAGVLLGLGGALLLLSFSGGQENKEPLKYGGLVVMATFCYAISVNGIKKFLSDLNSVKASVWAFMITGPLAWISLFSGDFLTRIENHPMASQSLFYICILAIVGSALSVMVFNVLIKLSGPVFASSCTYLIPIVAIFWGFLDGERIVGMQILAVFIVLGGIWLINVRKKEEKENKVIVD